MEMRLDLTIFFSSFSSSFYLFLFRLVSSLVRWMCFWLFGFCFVDANGFICSLKPENRWPLMIYWPLPKCTRPKWAMDVKNIGMKKKRTGLAQWIANIFGSSRITVVDAFRCFYFLFLFSVSFLAWPKTIYTCLNKPRWISFSVENIRSRKR